AGGGHRARSLPPLRGGRAARRRGAARRRARRRGALGRGAALRPRRAESALAGGRARAPRRAARRAAHSRTGGRHRRPMKHALIRRKLARVDRALDKAIGNAEIPGAVVLARMPREGELLEHASVRGYAVVRPERIPMARDTIFDLASLTKPLATATAVMLLCADGAIDLDEPVAKYLPAAGERGKEHVRVRHLLSHSAGLKPWRPSHEALLERERKKGERLLGTRAAKETILERICRSTLVHEPGEAAVYGDLDFIL